MNHVQALESRTLLSTVPVALFSDISALQTDAAAFKAGLGQAVPTLMADAKAIGTDLHSLPPSAQNRTLVAALRRDEAKSVATLNSDAALMFRAGGPKIGRAITDAMRLAAHPTDPAAHARLAADVATLQALDTALSSKFLSDGQTAATRVGGDLTGVAAANPASTMLQTDVTKTQGDMATLLGAVQTHFQSIQGDFQNLVNNLSAML
jgi:hypothetical protein